jgi:SNF2-related domain/Helicase conserved C-terminal domain
MSESIESVNVNHLTPADWQAEDLEKYIDLQNSADWSQMGCYKTSSALWKLERKLQHIENPSILVVTTAAGKGAYFRDIPKTISDKWQIINLKADGIYLIINGMQIKIGKRLAEKIDFPHIVMTHYALFSRSHINKFDECKDCDGRGLSEDFLQPCYVCDGKGKIPKKPTHCDPIIQRHWDMVILDEAHRIKNPDAKWTVNLKKLKTDHKHIITGSGFVNRPDEIWSLFNFLDKVEFSSYWDFRKEYCEEDAWNGYRTVVGLRKSKIADFRRLRESFGPRRTKPEVFPNLTAPIYEDIEVELNAIQRQMYDQIKYELMLLDQKGEPLHSPNVLSQLQRMRQISVATPDVLSDEYDPKQERRVVKIRLIEPSSKLDALMDILDGLQWDDEDKQQIVVFSNFRDPLEMLQKRLDKAGIRWIRLLPEDNDSVRYRKWAVDFPSKNHQVFMSTIKLGGESIDLTPAAYVALLDLDWAPMNNEQAIERVWRPGFDTSKGAPIVLRFFAEDTVDQRMLDMNETKKDWFNMVFGPNEIKSTVSTVSTEAQNWASML